MLSLTLSSAMDLVVAMVFGSWRDVAGLAHARFVVMGIVCANEGRYAELRDCRIKGRIDACQMLLPSDGSYPGSFLGNRKQCKRKYYMLSRALRKLDRMGGSRWSADDM